MIVSIFNDVSKDHELLDLGKCICATTEAGQTDKIVGEFRPDCLILCTKKNTIAVTTGIPTLNRAFDTIRRDKLLDTQHTFFCEAGFRIPKSGTL